MCGKVDRGGGVHGVLLGYLVKLCRVSPLRRSTTQAICVCHRGQGRRGARCRGIRAVENLAGGVVSDVEDDGGVLMELEVEQHSASLSIMSKMARVQDGSRGMVV